AASWHAWGSRRTSCRPSVFVLPARALTAAAGRVAAALGLEQPVAVLRQLIAGGGTQAALHGLGAGHAAAPQMLPRLGGLVRQDLALTDGAPPDGELEFLEARVLHAATVLLTARERQAL